MMRPDRQTKQDVFPICGKTDFVDNPHNAKYRSENIVFKKLTAGSATLKDLIALVVASILVVAFSVFSGGLDVIEEWERKNNLSNLHVENIVIVLIVLGIAITIFIIRRYQEMREDSISETMSDKDIGLVETRPARKYEELENLFHRVETAKKEWQLSLNSMREMVILTDLDGAIHRCNRSFKDFMGLPYEKILRENITSLLTEFGIDMKGLDLKTLNARFNISGKWFGVRSYSYKDFETNLITKVVIVMLEVSQKKLTEEKVQFVWGGSAPTSSG